MLQGSCLCGAISYVADGEVARLNLCHCRMCQKAHGSIFGPYLRVPRAGFTWQGDELALGRYRSSSDIERTFCRFCGSSLTWTRDSSDGMGIAAGTVDNGEVPDLPTAQFWCDEAPIWHRVRDDVPLYATEPATGPATKPD